MLDVLAAMHASDPDRWVPRRLILQNYWLFGEAEVFHFARGNLMLTGQNESGKSTVLVTAITLVLDMMLTPDRVDTMGSNDRSIRYYLIGKDDASPDAPTYHRERTAYIALELERGSSGVFQTIGIGLRSSRDWTNQKVERWGFVMAGPRRVAIDFHLHDGKQPPRPLRASELRDRLGHTGQVFADQQGYKAAVNEALFGFRSVKEYDSFLEMLHVVRTPKLGEGLNPRKVEAYLKESLPPIQSAAIEGASEVFSRLDTIEAELDHVRGQLETVRSLEEPQEQAVLASARQAAVAYHASSAEHGSRQKAHTRLLAQLAAARDEIAGRTAERARLAEDRAEIEGRLVVRQAQHREHGAFDLEARLAAVRREEGEASAAYAALRDDRRRAQSLLEHEEEQLKGDATSWTRQRGRLAERLDELAGVARRAFWLPLATRAERARDDLEGISVDGGAAPASELARSSIDEEVGGRRRVLAEIGAAHDALAAASGRLELSRRASDLARREFGEADERFRAAAREADAGRAGAAAALGTWRTGTTELRVPDAAFTEVLARLEAYDPRGHRPAAILAPLQPAHDEARDELRALAVELETVRGRVQGEVAEVEARLKRLATERDVEPDRTPAQAAARRLLREHGIAQVPLFAACDLAGPLAADAEMAARMEAALEDAGLLDALIIPAAEAERVRTLLDAHGLGDRWIAPADGGWEADEWLVPVASGGVSKEDVRAALRTLGLSGSGGVVSPGGAWRLGPLHGHTPAPAEARVRFVGETARREERRRRMDEARARLDELRGTLATLTAEIESVTARERALGREWRDAQELRALQALHDTLLAVHREEQERERRRKRADLAAETVETDTRDVQERTAALDRATDAAPYLKDRTKAEVDAVGGALREVSALARSVGEDVERLEEIRRTHVARVRRLDGLRAQLEELAPRIAQSDSRVRSLDAQLRTLEEQLSRASIGREELAAEIRALQGRLAEVATADEVARDSISQNTGKVAQLSEAEPDYAAQLRSAATRLQGDEAAFRTRLEAYPTLEPYLEAARGPGLDRAMQLILDDVDTAAVEIRAKEARDALNRAFAQASSTFEELSPTLDGDILRFTHEQGEMRLDELYRVLEALQVRNENLLEEEDRRLIEQLMLRDVVDAIRDAIRGTRRWVEEINATLGRMKLFKGGIMRLHWEVRPRESADAFDPRRLDDLLSQRGIALDESRRDELMEIFRRMVSDIRRKSRERELLVDYATALREMVAYQQWYTLSVQRRDESGRWMPLTRRVYGQGSGGRRTLDLLLPLIAAVSARLATADRAAPRLVGFDEAFAGVDDRNAAEIYALLTELGFCWIMATEKAAGLGAGVRGSASYEMLSDGVTVAPTLSVWDGERRLDFIGDELLGIETARTREVERAP
jgi:hypothetical protein